MKSLISCLILLLLSTFSYSQDTTFYNENWEVTSKDSAFYKENCDIESFCKAYYISGKLRFELTYKNNERGKFLSWYENGIAQEVGEYVNDRYILHSLLDSTGKELIKDGTGVFILYYKNGRVERKGNYIDGKRTGEWNYYFKNGEKIEQGNFVEDKKEGEWKGWRESGKLFYRESYKNDGLVEGTSFSQDGDSIMYTELTQEVSYPGGMEAISKMFSSQLKKSKKYLNKGEENKIRLKFAIEKDGTIQEAKILKGIHPELDKQALEILLKMKWSPATFRGQPVKRLIILPLNF